MCSRGHVAFDGFGGLGGFDGFPNDSRQRPSQNRHSNGPLDGFDTSGGFDGLVGFGVATYPPPIPHRPFSAL